jgi:ATP-dependent Clp protease ATP-binding subunit ClpC
VIHEQSPLSYLDDRAKRVVGLARQRAEGLRSDVIGPEHVLLALLSVRRGVAARALAGLAGSAATAETAIAEGLEEGARPSPVHIGFTITCEDAMVRAAQQANVLGDQRIGTEHLLLGLLLATSEPTVRRLSGLGVGYDAARAEIARLRADGTDRG